MREEQEKVVELVAKYREWKKRHPDFPLTVSPNGQWSKRVRGRTYYFGLLSDPDSAIRLWCDERDYLQAGLEPPAYSSGLTVKELCENFFTDLEDRIKTGEISSATRRNYSAAKRFLSEADFFYSPVECLTIGYFTALSQRLRESGRSLNTQKWLIIAIKAIFHWGKKSEAIKVAVDFGPRFVSPGIIAIEAEQEENGVVRFLDRETILGALENADAKMRVAILLGINCAFYPSDTLSMGYRHICLDAEIPYHNFRRVKTRRRRMAVLWPETVAAIEEYTDRYRPPGDCDNILLSRRGLPYSSKGGKTYSLRHLMPLPKA